MPHPENAKPADCPSKVCPVDSEGILLRQQRNEDAISTIGESVKTLVGKIDSLVDRIAAQELTTTKINTLERDLGHAFRDLRDLKDKFDAKGDQIIAEVKNSLDKHGTELENFKKDEFGPVKTQFSQWKGAISLGSVVAVALFGLAQYIALDKFAALKELQVRQQEQMVKMAEIRAEMKNEREAKK